MTIIREPNQVFDVRLLERYRAKGLFKDKDYKKFLSDLTDSQENADYISADIVLGKPEGEAKRD